MSRQFEWTDDLVNEFNRWYADNKGRYEDHVREFKAQWAKRSYPLFTAEDGHEVHDGDSIWCVSVVDRLFTLRQTVARPAITPVPSYFKYFYFHKNAYAFVQQNKPCLSVKQVLQLCEDIQFHNRLHDRADEDHYVAYVSLLKTRLLETVSETIPLIDKP
jgi:hypothetical protein